MGAGRGRSCGAQGTLLILFSHRSLRPQRAQNVPGPAVGVAMATHARSLVPLAAPRPVAALRPKSRRAPGSLPARLQRQRGPPRALCGSRAACLVPIQARLAQGREDREADTTLSLHLLDRGFPPSSPFLPSPFSPREAACSPPSPALPSLSTPGLDAGLGVTLRLLLGRAGREEGAEDQQQGRKFLGVWGFFFPPPFSEIWSRFLRYQRPLGAR